MSNFDDFEASLREKYFMVKQRAVFFFLGGLVVSLFSAGFIGYEIAKDAIEEAISSTSAKATESEIEGIKIRAARDLEEINRLLNDLRLGADQLRALKRDVRGHVHYTVQLGDSWRSIATRFNMNVDDLLDLNTARDLRPLQVGQSVAVEPKEN